MLIMGKVSKSPKTKPTEFLNSQKASPQSPKSVPIPPLTPGKKVDLNLLFSSQFTPIKVELLLLQSVLNCDFSRPHQFRILTQSSILIRQVPTLPFLVDLKRPSTNVKLTR